MRNQFKQFLATAALVSLGATASFAQAPSTPSPQAPAPAAGTTAPAADAAPAPAEATAPAPSAAAPATSAPAAPSADDSIAAARNQLGVLEYCQTEGHIDAKAIDAQTKMLGMLPAAGDAAKVEAAYEKGKTGVVSVMGIEKSLPDAAKEQGTDVGALCKQMGQMIEQAASQLPG